MPNKPAALAARIFQIPQAGPYLDVDGIPVSIPEDMKCCTTCGAPMPKGFSVCCMHDAGNNIIYSSFLASSIKDILRSYETQ